MPKRKLNQQWEKCFIDSSVKDITSKMAGINIKKKKKSVRFLLASSSPNNDTKSDGRKKHEHE